MADAIFEDRRLASICDSLDSDRSDLDVYVALVDEFSASSVLDMAAVRNIRLPVGGSRVSGHWRGPSTCIP